MENSYSFQYVIANFDDPRQPPEIRYPLDEVMLLCLCAVISGCETFVDIEIYGEEKLDFARFGHGIPSHDTLSAVFQALAPQAFGRAFAEWAMGLSTRISDKLVAIDGKISRGSKAGGGTPLHMISAYCVELQTVLGQRAYQHKKNEIKDIPPLLEMLYQKGAIVTFDAMGCQRDILQKIREKKAHYLLALKGNQGRLYADVKTWFEERDHDNSAFYQTVDGDKGRSEPRHYKHCANRAWLGERHPD